MKKCKFDFGGLAMCILILGGLILAMFNILNPPDVVLFLVGMWFGYFILREGEKK